MIVFFLPNPEKCQTELFSLLVGNVPFRLTHNYVANILMVFSCHESDLIPVMKIPKNSLLISLGMFQQCAWISRLLVKPFLN